MKILENCTHPIVLLHYQRHHIVGRICPMITVIGIQMKILA